MVQEEVQRAVRTDEKFGQFNLLAADGGRFRERGGHQVFMNEGGYPFDHFGAERPAETDALFGSDLFFFTVTF